MRKLEIPAGDHELYSLLMVAAESGELSGASQVRIAVKILDKLAAVGAETTEPAGPGWLLRDETIVSVVELEDAEFKDLVKRAEGVKWRAGAVRKAARLFEFFDTVR